MDHSDVNTKATIKKIVAVKYDAQMYANRLWNDMAIYAMGREYKAEVRFPSAFQSMKATRGIYELWAQVRGRILHPKESMWAWGGTIRYLPPTVSLPHKYHGVDSLYLLGMFFRNPAGFSLYADELRKTFSTPSSLEKRIRPVLTPLQGRFIIGVEIRQRPFTHFPEGDFLITLDRTREVVHEYLAQVGRSVDEVGLLISSDFPVPRTLFSEFATVSFTGKESVSFYALTHASVIVGTNSPISSLAAWLADIPHIVVLQEPIDWGYYKEKDRYFENKYSTLTQKISLN